MRQRLAFLALAVCLLASSKATSLAADGNRLAYLAENNPWYPHTDFPKLTTPQWVGEDGVEAVVVFAIDDMRDTAKYEAYLRPILQRLKQIDGRAPVSIMTCNVKPDDPQLQSWLEEGLSIDAHTVDHPCPLLQGGDFNKSKSTYDRCIDLLHQIPGNKPVAFRMPCCDSLNTVSPRFFSEIFNRTTPDGNYLSISSSVFTVFTSDDKSIPRDLVLNEDGSERFRRYFPKGLMRNGVEHNRFLNWIENYPYPYVINGSCWEFPCVVPSDWSAQFLQQPNNPKTLEDWKAAFDITVLKQGVFNLVFHPHGWIEAEQVVEFIDHAVEKHGKKVKFLTFREALARLNRNLLDGQPLRSSDGSDNGVRVLDVDRNGFMDVVTGNAKQRSTRLWQTDERTWRELDFPTRIGNGVHFTQVREDEQVSVLAPTPDGPVENPSPVIDAVLERSWYFDGNEWRQDSYLQKLASFSRAMRDKPLERLDKAVSANRPAATRTWRFRDIDHDGRCEAFVTWRPLKQDGLVGTPQRTDVQVFRPLSRVKQRRPGDPVRVPVGPPTWRQLAFAWPAGSLAPKAGVDPGLFRFVDLDRDGNDDLIASTHHGSFVSLFDSTRDGWSTPILNVDGNDSRALPPIISEDGSNNGFLVHSGFLAWQNENTDHLPDLVDKVSIDDLLAEHRRREARLTLDPVPVGAAKIDITPDYPVRLSGYGSRMTESEGVAHRIHARAMAIGGEGSRRGAEAQRKDAAPKLSAAASLRENPPLTVLLSVDTCGVPADVTERVFALLAEQTALRREHFAVSSTHTHSAPWLMGFAPNLFAEVPDEHRATMQKYESELVKKLVHVAHQAIEQRRPGRLSVGFGRVDFATNRRALENGKWTGFGVVPDGPVDRRLPVLAAHDTNGKLITVLANYACHCTTETGSFNQISGDWAGFAAEYIEDKHPDAVALISIGAGADANPEPRGTHELSKQHGRELADEVNRLLSAGWVEQREAHQNDQDQSHNTETQQDDGGPRFTRPTLQLLDPRVIGRMARVDLPLGPLPTREEWEQRAKEGGTRGSHARRFLGMLDRGEDVPTTIPDYPVQTWCFGEDLAMVFLGGEVVVDYALRMSDTFDGDRLWLNAYSNAMPSYIASKRVLQEGGYEADFSMIYYARPTRLAPVTEDIIVDTVQKLLPQEFYSEATQQDFPAPKSPEDSAACIQVKPGLKVELVAAEPLITDPVAFDWDIQGRLWVVEMGDYPGVKGARDEGRGPREERNGRIRVLNDVDGDGRYDEATTFLDDIGFPTGICRWRNGVLITAAPEIIYAEDTDGDGQADIRKTLYRGFNEGNQQHRVNGLQWGLDGWLHVGNGDSGGEIKSFVPDKASKGAGFSTPLNVSGRDLKIRPDTGEMLATSGQTQFGRARDDWGNWFGNNNSNPIWHYVLQEEYLGRNPFAPVRSTKAAIAEVPGAAPVFPISRTLARFNDFSRADHFTSACSTTIYRDSLLGEEFYGDAFVCEPVHNLVSRLVLKSDGVTFKAARSPNEQDSEFFASSDNWTRPVMVRTGPDGALWVADMYRFVIEHPQWIPAEQQRKLDLYAGSDRGRIYRIVRESNTACCGDTQPEPAGHDDLRSPFNEEWNKVPLAQLINRIGSPNGWWRDAAHRLLLHRAADTRTAAEVPASRPASDNNGYGGLSVPALSPKDSVVLRQLIARHPSPQTRLQAMCVADALEDSPLDYVALLKDPHPQIRRHALRLIGNRRVNGRPLAEMRKPPERPDAFRDRQSREFKKHQQAVAEVFAAVRKLADDPSPSVQLQFVNSFGRHFGDEMGRIAMRHANDTWISTAAFASLTSGNIEAVLGTAVRAHQGSIPGTYIARLIAQAVAFKKIDVATTHILRLLPAESTESHGQDWATAAAVMTQVSQFAGARQKLLTNDQTRQQLSRAAGIAITTATSTGQPPETRAAALTFARDSGVLSAAQIQTIAKLLAPQNPATLQSAAVETIAATSLSNASEILLAGWKSHSPYIRGKIASLLTTRIRWSNELLTAIDEGIVGRPDLDAAQRERLLAHRDPAIRGRASKLFNSGTGTSSRQSVVESLTTALDLTADVARGRTVFEKRCASCHKLGDLGKSIGADLAALKNRSGEVLLTAILDPNRAVEAKFLSYIAVTNDGRTFSGMMLSETGNSITLIGTDGKEQTLLRADLEELIATNRSLMPEGLEKDLAPQDLADVIAFVQSFGAKWKSFPGNEPRLITAADDRTLLLPAGAAEIYGPSLILEAKYANLGWWSSTDDYAVWTIETKQSGFYRVELDYACDDSTSGGAIRFSTGTRLLTARVPGTGTWDNYRTWSAGEIDLRRGRQQLTVSALAKPPHALIDLKAIRLIPVE